MSSLGFIPPRSILPGSEPECKPSPLVGTGWQFLPLLRLPPLPSVSSATHVYHILLTPLENIWWKTFIIYAVLNACFLPMVCCFYPETKGIELEDIPLLFVKGGVTGGVLSS